MLRITSRHILGIIARSIHIIQFLILLAHTTEPSTPYRHDTYNPLNTHKLKPTLRLMI